eukprot:TRINITY_DN24313_c0_g1_i2.p1 TRINITY_DN24313_c0_g1~~TRINITY_DN24313_c0_g1_i2.p1  ORF type:complete len:114 (+),score=7.99 TRINITY_DN24313_c0_g1_i2:26-367(+)
MMERTKGSVMCGGWGIFFFQAEDGIRDHAQSRGLGDVYKRQAVFPALSFSSTSKSALMDSSGTEKSRTSSIMSKSFLLKCIFDMLPTSSTILALSILLNSSAVSMPNLSLIHI